MTAFKIIKKAVLRKLKSQEYINKIEEKLYFRLENNQEFKIKKTEYNFSDSIHNQNLPDGKFVHKSNCPCEYCRIMNKYIETKKRRHRFKKAFEDDSYCSIAFDDMSLETFNEKMRLFDLEINQLKNQKDIIKEELRL